MYGHNKWKIKEIDRPTDQGEENHPYSSRTIPSTLCPLILAHSIANKEAFKNFLCAYFLQTYWREKPSSVSLSVRRLCPGKSCSSVHPEKKTKASP